MTQPGVAVRRNDTRQQFEAETDGHLAVIQYRMEGDRIVFLHTEVPQELGGRGVGSTLAKAALEDARVRGLTVVPLCPFVRAYIERHQEYLPIVDEDHRAQLAGTPREGS